jgi:hypothetical protein
MSLQISTRAWSVTGITMTQKLVLMRLADYANDQGACWPSVAAMARECCCTERSVYTAIAELEKQGHITRQNRCGTSSVYHIDPCTTFTPEPRSPLNQIHTPPEPDSYPPCTTFTPPLNDVHPNRNRTVIEPPLNHHKGDLFDDAPKKPKRKKRESIPLEEIKLAFESEAFAKAWADFVEMRREIRKPIPGISAKAMMAQLQRDGEELAIAKLNQSVLGSWQNLYPLKNHTPSKPTHRRNEYPQERIDLP